MPLTPENLRELNERQKIALRIYVSEGEFKSGRTCTLFKSKTGVHYNVGNFSKMRRSKVAADFMDELLREQGIIVTSVRNKVVEEYSAVAFSKITDVIQVDKSGNINVIAFDDLSKATQSAIKKVKLVRKKRGEGFGEFEDILEIEMHDKLGALNGLSTILNLQRRIGEELDEKDESNVLQFAGVKIIGPIKEAVPAIDLTLPEES